MIRGFVDDDGYVVTTEFCPSDMINQLIAGLLADGYREIEVDDEGLPVIEALASPQIANIESKIDDMRALIKDQRTIKDWYSVNEVAAIVKRAAWTVREWCRDGRIDARKRETGRGDTLDWEIPRTGLEHYREHGLRPRPGK